MRAYWTLTKPRISSLFAITGLAAMVLEGSLLSRVGALAWVTLGIFCVGGGANALNQFFERDIDKLMARTAERRPLPQGKLTPPQAAIFGVLLCGLGVGLLTFWGSPLAGFLGLLTILYYSFFYTLWLKPRTPYSIVVGGAGGATAPLIGWAAATQTLAWPPIILFLLIFFWTPAHFWSLALGCQEDYQKAGLPMLPNVAGEKATRRQIFGYSLTLLPLSLSLILFNGVGWIYPVTATLLGLGFLWGGWRVYHLKTEKGYRQFFFYSILYLLLIFVCLIIDQFFV